MKIFTLLVISVITCIKLSAQSITILSDTVICSDDSITLYAEVTGSISTNEYTYEDIPFAPESYAGTNPFPTASDDIHSGAVPIGFNFDFFCNTYTDVYFSTNGWISFTIPPGGGAGTSGAWDVNYGPGGGGTFGFIPVFASDVPRNCIMGPWQDWYPPDCTGTCVKYQTIGTAPNRKFVATWDAVPMFDCWATTGTFQIVLNETSNIIENHIEQKNNCLIWENGYATQGIQNSDATIGYAAPGRNATVWTASNESIRWVPSIITWYDLSTGAIVGTGDSLIVAPSVTTSYSATVTLCDGSTVADTATVTVAAPYTVTYEVQNITCNGSGNAWIDIDVTGNINPVTYLWSNGETTDSISNLSPGIYTVTVQETGGCKTDLEFTITEPSLLTLDTIETKNITCFGGNDGYVYLNADGGVPPYIFTVDGSTWIADSNITGLVAGTYDCIVQDTYGCRDTITISLSQPPDLIVDAGQNQTISYGGVTNLNATTTSASINTIIWSPADGLSCSDCLNPQASPEFTTNYIITITDNTGCTASDNVIVYVELDYVVPNAFSPNSDGLNDNFSINAAFIATATLEIYDRWGKLIYQTNDITRGWDGTFEGKPQEVGTYIYRIVSQTYTGTQIEKSGSIILLR